MLNSNLKRANERSLLLGVVALLFIDFLVGVFEVRIHLKPIYWTKDVTKEVIKSDALLWVASYAVSCLSNDVTVAQAVDKEPMIYCELPPPQLAKIDLFNNDAVRAAKNLP